MRKALIVVCLLLSLPALPTLAAEGPPPFHLIFRQENVVKDEVKTSANVMINVINRSGSDAQDILVSIPMQNPYLPNDVPVFFGTIPDGRQSEVLQLATLANDIIAAAEPEEKVVWRIEYTNQAGERTSVDVKGENGF